MAWNPESMTVLDSLIWSELIYARRRPYLGTRECHYINPSLGYTFCFPRAGHETISRKFSSIFLKKLCVHMHVNEAKFEINSSPVCNFGLLFHSIYISVNSWSSISINRMKTGTGQSKYRNLTLFDVAWSVPAKVFLAVTFSVLQGNTVSSNLSVEKTITPKHYFMFFSVYTR